MRFIWNLCVKLVEDTYMLIDQCAFMQTIFGNDQGVRLWEHVRQLERIRYFVYANTSMLLCWKHYMLMGRKCLRKRNNLDFFSYFHSINDQFLH